MPVENKTACISLNTVFCETKSQSLGLSIHSRTFKRIKIWSSIWEELYSKTFWVFEKTDINPT